jgi:spore germination cell wall hydrolase CwlJ-like protein
MLLLAIGAAPLAGCANHIGGFGKTEAAADPVATELAAKERECLVRAMYFESNRSSEDGLMAVGTVVMNRVESAHYPNTICEVVGQKRQFAYGVLTRKMDDKQRVLADRMADQIVAGKRYEPIGKAMYFHAASIRIPYKNTDYLTVAGGNAFYRKVDGGGRQLPPLAPEVQTAAAEPEAKKPEAEEVSAEQALADAEGEAFKQGPIRMLKASFIGAPAEPEPAQSSFADEPAPGSQGNVTQIAKTPR